MANKKAKKKTKKTPKVKEVVKEVVLVQCGICGASLKREEARVQTNTRIGKFFSCIGPHRGKK